MIFLCAVVLVKINFDGSDCSRIRRETVFIMSSKETGRGDGGGEKNLFIVYGYGEETQKSVARKNSFLHVNLLRGKCFYRVNWSQGKRVVCEIG